MHSTKRTNQEQYKATASMKGVVVDKVGGPYKVVEDLEKPKPGPDQILVKSITTAINPV